MPTKLQDLNHFHNWQNFIDHPNQQLLNLNQFKKQFQNQNYPSNQLQHQMHIYEELHLIYQLNQIQTTYQKACELIYTSKTKQYYQKVEYILNQLKQILPNKLKYKTGDYRFLDGNEDFHDGIELKITNHQFQLIDLDLNNNLNWIIRKQNWLTLFRYDLIQNANQTKFTKMDLNLINQMLQYQNQLKNQNDDEYETDIHFYYRMLKIFYFWIQKVKQTLIQYYLKHQIENIDAKLKPLLEKNFGITVK